MQSLSCFSRRPSDDQLVGSVARLAQPFAATKCLHYHNSYSLLYFCAILRASCTTSTSLCFCRYCSNLLYQSHHVYVCPYFCNLAIFNSTELHPTKRRFLASRRHTLELSFVSPSNVETI